MPLFLDTGQAAAELNAANCVTVGLVNNMPDAAFEATERQFTGLLREAAPSRVVLLKLFAIPQLPRSAETQASLAGKYRDIAALWDTPLDGLIVTGTEPRAADLKDEPYWPALSAVVDWARDNTASTIWSCLAAHAAVLHSDGIARVKLPQKQFGVFDCRLAASHPMTQHFPEPLWVPHSRYNTLPEAALTAAGYRILTGSATAGVDAFAKQDGSFFLFFQGHPEYDADTLFREYRRDVSRFLNGEREALPGLPQNYFDDVARARAEAFAERAAADRRGALMAEFPKQDLEAGLQDRWQNTWRPAALGVYQKWVEFLSARKAERRTADVAIKPARLRRTWRDWPLPLRQPASGSAH
jgi:homoserine O-succinyltransferase